MGRIEQRKHESQLGEARGRLEVEVKRLDRFFTLSLDLMSIASLDGYFRQLNPSWERTLGYTTEELKSRPFTEFVHPDDHQAMLDAVRKLEAGEPVAELENRFRARDGSYRWLVWNAAPDVEERLIYAVARDVTERKQAELALQVSNRELETFSYSVSHDLRAPVRAIKGFSSMIADNHAAELTPASARLLEVVIRNADQMDELIDGLLSFSRLGRLEMRSVEVDMRALAQTVFDELQESSGGGATLLLGDLPPATGDPVLLRQVFANLIGNAIKFSSRASEPLIEIASSTDTAMNEYQVKDNGVGFNMDYADRLFGVFQRLHSSDDFEGTGIGLANVQRIVHRHGGTARAEGSPGEGATFYFTLPSAS
jgi:PAS domain S-box-containing protein